MAILNFGRRRTPEGDGGIAAMLDGFSIEVMPRTAAKIEDFRALLPRGTRVYIAHIDGTPIDEMVATARRLAGDGFEVMPHFPARMIADRAMLDDWIARYQGEADVRQALVLAGGLDAPRGDFDSSIALLETGAFDAAGFTRLHVAGHPEGNRDIDPDGGVVNVEAALKWKAEFAERSDARMAIVTQFLFEPDVAVAWAEGVRAAGIDLPIHLGVAGPAKLQTMIKFAMACGVGPSVRVLKRRAADVTKLVLPYEPDEMVAGIAQARARNPDLPIERLHFFPLGGIQATADWLQKAGGAATRTAARTA